jgi:ribosomal protein S14
MNYLINKDQKRRLLVNKYELKRKLLKSIIYNLQLPKYVQFLAITKLNSFPKESSIVRIRNRCVITGRSRSVYKDFKLSRMMLRSFALNGFLTGITKSSW